MSYLCPFTTNVAFGDLPCMYPESRKRHAISKGHTMQQLLAQWSVSYHLEQIDLSMRLDSSSNANACSLCCRPFWANRVALPRTTVIIRLLCWASSGTRPQTRRWSCRQIWTSTPEWWLCLYIHSHQHYHQPLHMLACEWLRCIFATVKGLTSLQHPVVGESIRTH